jgi:exopolyphosphatase / guanosine-5'-triphosphate,3'-diphosphate pyrophosphatase
MDELSIPTPEPTAADAPAFPLRVAAVDIGSNAIRFLSAELPRPGVHHELESTRIPVRLGMGAFRDGALAPEAMDAAVSALCGVRRRMEALGIQHYRAVATSAVRDSRNGAAFAERVRGECGLEIHTISGVEEARLVWLAVRRRLALGERPWILVDLGGGSVEVSLVDAAGVRWSESHLVGTVRMLADVGPEEDHTPEQFRRRLEDHAAMLRSSAAAEGLAIAGMIATGGNSEALASLCGAPAGADGVRRLPVADLRAAIDSLAALSCEERIRTLGLRPDRADVILPAGIVYERLATLAGAAEIAVPGVGVKDGALLDLVDDLASHGVHEERLDREMMAHALTIGERYAFDEPHARQVARLSLSLFDQLQAAHGLTETDRRILLAAALLHDIGQFVSYRRHHKHSYYLLSNAELPGIAPPEIALVALVARYHRRAEPKESHEGYADLPAEERRRVDLLASLLRIADALDREHLQQVEKVAARVEDGELRLTMSGAGDLLPEEWAVRKKAEMFERVFQLRLRLGRSGTPGA